MSKPKPCTPCARARKFLPAALRKKLERAEQKMLERKAAQQEPSQKAD